MGNGHYFYFGLKQAVIERLRTNRNNRERNVIDLTIEPDERDDHPKMVMNEA